MVVSKGDFLQLLNTKGDLLGLNTSNPISSNSLRQILANFMTLHIFLLTATLTLFGTSVGGWNVPEALSKARHFACDEVGSV